jgi:hypothetical protein
MKAPVAGMSSVRGFVVLLLNPIQPVKFDATAAMKGDAVKVRVLPAP